MNLKLIIGGVIIFAAVGTGSFFTYKHFDTKKTSPSGTQPALQFQPEAQMLTQATDPATDLNDQASGSSNNDHPVTANTSTKYAYDSNTCENSSTEYLCLISYYKSVVDNYGVDTAFSDIKQRYNQNALVVTECHPLMHAIGQEASKAYATVAEAYEHGDNFCWSGYYHGIMEGVVGRIGLSNLPAQLNSICADIPGKATYDFNYYNCVHGLGHGIMEVDQDDVFDSLHMCDNLTGTWEQESCYSGVYMENIINNDQYHNSKFLKTDDPLYPCDAVDAKYKSECYLGQTSYALEVTGYNFGKVFGLCATVAEPYRDICNQSMGRDAANQAYHEAQKTKDTCWIATDPNDQTNCVIGAVKEIISYYHSETQALQFCNILDDANKATCKSTADSYYSVF